MMSHQSFATQELLQSVAISLMFRYLRPCAALLPVPLISACGDGGGSEDRKVGDAKIGIDGPSYAFDSWTKDAATITSYAYLSRYDGRTLTDPTRNVATRIDVSFERAPAANVALLESLRDGILATRSDIVCKLDGRYDGIDYNDYTSDDIAGEPTDAGAHIALADTLGFFASLTLDSPDANGYYNPYYEISQPDNARRAASGTIRFTIDGNTDGDLALGEVDLPDALPLTSLAYPVDADKGMPLEATVTWDPGNGDGIVSVSMGAFDERGHLGIKCRGPDNGAFALPTHVREQLPTDFTHSERVSVFREETRIQRIANTLVIKSSASTEFLVDASARPL